MISSPRTMKTKDSPTAVPSWQARMVRRHVGRNLSIKPVEERKVYRPFYIAIYGDMVEGTKARYMPIAADGNVVCRNF